MIKYNLADDKAAEHNRYDKSAAELYKALLDNILEIDIINTRTGARAISEELRSPYIYYENLIQSLITSSDNVLELGSGSGLHTEILLATGANVLASDISCHSLSLIEYRYQSYQNLLIQIADIENLPFKNCQFDYIVSAGTLSYGDSVIVMNEIYRVLKPGGYFICVDSLNHNPIYRLNRWVHYLRGNRSFSTLKQMPKISNLSKYHDIFGEIKIRYFGGISWLMPLLIVLIGKNKSAIISDYWDRKMNTTKSAFKFVMSVRKVK